MKLNIKKMKTPNAVAFLFFIRFVIPLCHTLFKSNGPSPAHLTTLNAKRCLVLKNKISEDATRCSVFVFLIKTLHEQRLYWLARAIFRVFWYLGHFHPKFGYLGPKPNFFTVTCLIRNKTFISRKKYIFIFREKMTNLWKLR